MATPLFDKMYKRLPELKELSAKRFSKLRRDELYKIAKAARNAKLDRWGYFDRYNSQSTSDLASSALNWISLLK